MTRQNIARQSPTTAMLRIFGATALALALLLGIRVPASAQSACTTHADMAEQLESKFAESRVALGLTRNGGLIEVFATGDGTTWTIVVTGRNGQSCIVAEGETWESLPGVAPGQEVRLPRGSRSGAPQDARRLPTRRDRDA